MHTRAEICLDKWNLFGFSYLVGAWYFSFLEIIPLNKIRSRALIEGGAMHIG